MASLPIGSDVNALLQIKAGPIEITFKGKAEHPSTPGVVYLEPCAHFRCKVIGPNNDFHVIALGKEIQIGEDGTFDVLLPPLFFEQQAYSVYIGCRESDCEVSVWHTNQSIRNSLTHPSARYQNVLFGTLNFSNDIGLSDFLVRINGSDYLSFTIEVFPCKIDYLNDYKNIMADVTSEVFSLVFDFLKKTYQNFEVGNETVTSPVEFFGILNRIYSEYLRSADIVLSRPHHTLTKEYRQVPSFKAKTIDNRCEKWLINHPSHIAEINGEFESDRCLTVHKQVTVDTLENRMIKFILSSTVKQMEAFLLNYQEMDRTEDETIVMQIHRMISGIRRRLNSPALADVPVQPERIELSSVFVMASGYRTLFKFYLMLKRGLSITGGHFNMSLKDVAQLYEYWCFIKLNHLLRTKYHLESQDFIKVTDNGIFVTLAKGGSSIVSYSNPNKPGDVICLSYNKDYGSSSTETVSQKPDNVLSLSKANKFDGHANFSYVFDAKYRIDPAKNDDYGERHNHLPGPQEGDINTMHRYRDAIIAGRPNGIDYRRSMFGAYVLFPYQDEKQYEQQDFYKSIRTVNVGGLPFLPGSTRLVEKMLDSLIEESPDSAFSRTILPEGIEEKLASVDWNKRDVLVGVLGRKEQLNICLTSRCYWVPASQLPESSLPVHFVALYQSNNLFKGEAGVTFYGEVLLSQKRRRKNIPGFQGGSRDGDQPYYLFSVKDWQSLPVSISPKESASTVLMTNLFLLKHSEHYPELRICSEDEFRLDYELKWLLKMGEVNDTDPQKLTFECLNSKIFIQTENICLADSNGNIFYRKPVGFFRARPGEVIKDIMSHLGANNARKEQGNADNMN